MPKVGKMKFPYTEQGMKEAASYAKNSGRPMQVEGNYRHGGMVPKYQAGGMVPNRPNPMGGPRPGPQRYSPRPPEEGINEAKASFPLPKQFGVHGFRPRGDWIRRNNRPSPMIPSIGNQVQPGETSPRPPGAGMTPPVNPGLMGGRMNPRMRRALMNRLAKFKKGIN
tara:strand:- start:52 stop:552 length:501 start_codon:yes stop_codon:yes gene_type:complete